MKNSMRSKVTALLILVMCLTSFAATVCAAEALSLKVPVSVTLSGDIPQTAEEYTIKWKAADAATPMPEGSTDNVYTVKVTGEGKAVLPEIVYPATGIYEYTVWQEKGSNPLATYDSSVYSVKIYVTNATDGSGLESIVVAYVDGNEKKLNDIAFHNIYKNPPAQEEAPAEPPKEDKIDVLIQTGQQNWLVFVLIGVGIVLLTFGGTLLGKRKEDA